MRVIKGFINKFSLYSIRQAQQTRIDNIMRFVSFEKIVSTKPVKKDILFVMPTIYPHSGLQITVTMFFMPAMTMITSKRWRLIAKLTLKTIRVHF